MAYIDKEQLIQLVKERPILWDKTLPTYKDKAHRTLYWREICGILNEDFDNLDEKDSQEFLKHVIKTWSHTRDSWLRNINVIKLRKTTGIVPIPRPYLYHNQLKFLRKVSGTDDEDDTNRTGNSSDETGSHDIDDTVSTTKYGNYDNRHKRKINKLKIKNDKHMNKINVSTDRHLAFFKSIQPTLNLFDDDQILQYQAGVMNLLQSIKKQSTDLPTSQPNLSMVSLQTQDNCKLPEKRIIKEELVVDIVKEEHPVT